MIEVKIKRQQGNICLDIDQSIPSSGITAIFGRSGSGKTSFINMIAGLYEPDSGKISIKEKTLFDKDKKINVAIEKRNVGYVFQDARLFPHYSVKGNLLYGVKSNLSSVKLDHIITLLNLSALLNRFPSELSGGEKQRVAIARALLSEPDILLMDEPLASLDLPRKKEIMPFLERLSQEVHIPILYVTHSLNEILRLADHIILMDKGKAVVGGSLESVWGTEAMKPWQSFSEQSSLFEARIARHHDKYALSKVWLSDNIGLWVQYINEEPGTPIRLQIRANDVSVTLEKPQLTSVRNILAAKVVAIESVTTKHGSHNVALKLDLGAACYLKANITQWAFDELGLYQGQSVFAQIKGVSVAQKDMAMKQHLT